MLTLSLLSITASLLSQTPILNFQPVISTGLSSPIDIVNAADGSNRMFIVQRGGTIRYMRNGVLSDTVFLNIAPLTTQGGERGLLSMAFHPAYGVNGYFFLYYTNLAGDVTIARYRVSADPNLADPASGQVLLAINHREFNNHNGGKLNFGIDGNLYFAVGDGGSANDPHFNAQNGTLLLGKMMRIKVDSFATAPFYSIPAGNPFAADNDNIRDEIWAFGLRNPFRWSFDRLTNDMWIGDVGQNNREEIDFRAATDPGGSNFGWRCYEGNRSNIDSGCQPAANYVFPVFDYDRTNANGGQTVTGGYVYRGTAYPELYGWYICIDYFSTNAWMIRPLAGGWNVQKQSGLPTSIVAFGEDETGELYASSLNGIIFRVQSAGILPVTFLSFNGTSRNNMHEITWNIAVGQSFNRFEVQWSPDGLTFTTVGNVAAANGSTTAYRFSHPAVNNSNAFYRLKCIDGNGQITYSSILQIRGGNDLLVKITPNRVTSEKVHIVFYKPFQTLRLSDMNGKTLKEISLRGNPGSVDVDLSAFSKGMYLVTCSGGNGVVVQKIVKE